MTTSPTTTSKNIRTQEQSEKTNVITTYNMRDGGIK